MSRGPLHALALAALAATLAACKGPTVPRPFAGQSRWLCCNLFYEKPKINDGDYQRGTMIPFGTPVEVLEMSRRTVTFQATGHPAILVQLRYGRKVLTMDQYVERLFVTEDPHARLRRPPARKGKRKGKGREQARDREEVERMNQAIERAQVVPGMTRAEVLMAIGYPPAHKTPSLDAATWTYWDNAFTTFFVHFDGDAVAQVQR